MRSGGSRATRSWWRFQRLAFACPLVCMALPWTVIAFPPTTQAVAAEDPDVLYQDREQLAPASKAAEIWAARVTADARDFDAAWKLARARCWIGERTVGDKKPHYELGIKAARQAIAAEPRRPQGHFWLAANMGSLADGSPIVAGLKYRGAIREALEAAIRFGPDYSRGVGYCALGKYYLRVPWLFGGSKTKAEKLIRTCLAYDSTNAMGRYFLAQTLIALGREAEARMELQRVLEAPDDPEYGPETRQYRLKAERLLKKLG